MEEAASSAVGGMTETIGLPTQPRLTDEVPPNIPDYRLIKIIGRGAFGTVWLAEEPLAGLFRAIKVLDGGGRGRRARAELTNRELAGLHKYQTLAQGHPNLIQVFKTGLCKSSGQHVGSAVRTDPDARDAFVRTVDPTSQASSLTPQASVYYVMEIADHAGGARPHRPMDYRPLTLTSLIRRQGRLPPTSKLGRESLLGRDGGVGIIETALALLDAIEHLHKAGIHHRDIKPSNILFVGGVLKLADIGLVSDEHDERVGTTGYLPPEGKPNDLYAFGKVLYEMVTGLPASAFPEWPGDWGVTPPIGKGLKRNRRGSYEGAEPSASADSRLAGLCRLVNGLCHPEASKRLAGLGVCRAELKRIGAPMRAKVITRRRAALLAAVGIPLSLVAGGYFVQVWKDWGDPTKTKISKPPYDGTEWRFTATIGGRSVGLIRNHAPGAEYTLYGRVAFSDLQTRLDAENGKLVVAGIYQVFSIENPVSGDVEHPKGEILQLFLAGGDEFELLHYAQSLPWPGVRQRFVRSLPIDPVLKRTDLHCEVRLVAVPAVTPEAAIESCRAYPENMKDNSIRIALLSTEPIPTSRPGR